MANGVAEIHKHFMLEGFTETEPYRTPQRGGGGRDVPERERRSHAQSLHGQIAEVRAAAERAAEDSDDLEDGLGIQVEFQSFPDVDAAFEKLSRESQGIELRNIRHCEDATFATVFVPDGKLGHFERLIEEYVERKCDSIGRPRDNRKLIDAIQAIRTASVRALWTDDNGVFPQDETEKFWCEIWLPVKPGHSADTALRKFRRRADSLGMEVAHGERRFPERCVVVARTSLAAIKRSVAMLNSIAELRRAKETANFFDSLDPEEQAEWVRELSERTTFDGDHDAPHVCLFDTGVSRGHPLISPSLDTQDCHTVEPGWGAHDSHGHGTQMAGIAIYGDLTERLTGNEPLRVSHRLESVKLLHDDGANGTDSRHYGYLTTEAVARPEITVPDRPRVFGMAVTARDNRDRGRPTSWSATLDALAADSDNQSDNPRLMVVSAGNVDGNEAWRNYPESNDSDGIHDPAQAWNALTVGAFTRLTRITESDTQDCEPVAPTGALSPFSTTSLTWQKNLWPLKPDIVLEGGNAAIDALGAVTVPSLSLLTTHYEPNERLFTTTNATSAATALASRMAAQIMAVYPELWPEAIRALIVHSAEWTKAMKDRYLPNRPLKTNYRELVQRCGYGVPDLRRALWTVSNALTMVFQGALQPFQKIRGKDATTCDMHLHRLPWPEGTLESLGDMEVELRVTLSYFIEPNPSQRGNSRYRYPSHGLRFDVRRPTEPIDAFKARVNAAANQPDRSTSTEADSSWLLGAQNRHRGSLHSDIWRGTAADLASRACIAVYPTNGWWRTRKKLGCENRSARYALAVSIRAPDAGVDLRTEVANRIAASIET